MASLALSSTDDLACFHSGRDPGNEAQAALASAPPSADVFFSQPRSKWMRQSLMRYRLRKDLGYSTIHRIGDYLRAHGTGKHWVEKYRGDIFIHASEDRDEAILRTEFADVLEPTPDTVPGEPH